MITYMIGLYDDLYNYTSKAEAVLHFVKLTTILRDIKIHASYIVCQGDLSSKVLNKAYYLIGH